MKSCIFKAELGKWTQFKKNKSYKFDFDIYMAPKIDEIGYMTHAENLGYSQDDGGCYSSGDRQVLVLLPQIVHRLTILSLLPLGRSNRWRIFAGLY
jgi:hypothetical protein